MAQKAVRLIAILVILSFLLQTTPTQARPMLLPSEATPPKVLPEGDPQLPEGLTSAEWQSIQSQIPWKVSQQAYLKASDTATQDWFGHSVAISGDTLVVGAIYKQNLFNKTGAAYVFVRNGTSWEEQAILSASNPDGGDRFGYSVAISGDTIVVGAHQEDGSSTGVDQPHNNNASGSGAAYVFVRSESTWTQQAYLKASNTGAGDFFGRSVAISRDTIVVGAPNEDSKATTVDGDGADDTAPEAGAAYVFARTGVAWKQTAYLKAFNTNTGDNFGNSVAVFGNRIIVGAPYEDSSFTGVNSGGQADNSALEAGAAYVFARSDTTWSQQAYVKADNTGGSDWFGWSVAIYRDKIVVGAYREATGDSNVYAGAVYVFGLSGTDWTQQGYLKASNADAGDYFGFSVAISGDTIVVGALGEGSNATGIDGDQENNGKTDSGAAYVFVYNGSTWLQQAYMKASNTGDYDNFGHSVAISVNVIVVSAPYEDSSSMGVDGEQQNDDAPDSGAAYVFNINNAPVAGTDSPYTTNEDTTLTVPAAEGVLVNDTDPNGDALTTVLLSGTTHGSLILLIDGSFTYKPATGFYGQDQFIYQAYDDDLYSEEVTVTITVNPINDAPVAQADEYSIEEGSTLSVEAAKGVLKNDSDVDSINLTAIQVHGVSNGTLTLASDGSFTYIPAKSFYGQDQFIYKAYDGKLYSEQVTVTITVIQVIFPVYLPMIIK